MSQHPLNLALRFVLKLTMLAALGIWAGPSTPALGESCWRSGFRSSLRPYGGAFRVPEDHGKGLVNVPGYVRLTLEAVLFIAATAAFAASGWRTAAFVFGLVTALHYLASYDRVARLLRHVSGAKSLSTPSSDA